MAQPWALTTRVSHTSEKSLLGSRLVTRRGTATGTLELRRDADDALYSCIIIFSILRTVARSKLRSQLTLFKPGSACHRGAQHSQRIQQHRAIRLGAFLGQSTLVLHPWPQALHGLGADVDIVLVRTLDAGRTPGWMKSGRGLCSQETGD